MAENNSFDYVIVGAGSAGCVLANRLSEEYGVRVMILEAGKPDRHPWLKLPLKFRDLAWDKRFNWGYVSEPEPHMENRQIVIPRGKVLGGSSSINGMIYSRGHPTDYDHWRQLGLSGWGYRDVLPYFKRSQNHHGGESKFHGAGGPLTVSRGDDRSEPHKVYMAAAKAAGHPVTEDLNGEIHEGFGAPEFTINRGRRASAARAFLEPALARGGVTLVTSALANRVLFENGRAVGVEYRHGGAVKTARAEREVILSGGAYNSPQLLMLSGIGPADHLREHGIGVRHDSPSVGQNLQDHFATGVGYHAPAYKKYDAQLRLDRLTIAVLQWAIFRSGYLMGLPVNVLSYIKTRPDLPQPDIELLMGRMRPDSNIWFPGFRKPPGGFVGCRVVLLHPESRGWVKLRSPDPAARVVIYNDYFAAPKDLATMREGIRRTREVYRSEPFKGVAETELFPGDGIQTDDEIDAYVRKTAEVIYHPVGTCRMGEDVEAVVDGRLRVKGVQGLRVVDASVMPTVVGGHTNAPTIMIAEKASDFIRGREPLPPADL